VSTKLKIGEVLRVRAPQASGDDDPRWRDLKDYRQVTKGTHAKPANINRGIFCFQNVTGPDHKERCPAVLLYSDNLKGQTKGNPWLDIIRPDDGHGFYHGDNRTPGQGPFGDGRDPNMGNKQLLDLLICYNDPTLRALAPPLLVFESIVHDGKRKGFRKFSGYGIPRNMQLLTQGTEAEGYFTNIAVDLTLFSLAKEDEVLDWAWIDDRRDEKISAHDCLKTAPAAWRDWVNSGESALQRCQRRAYSRRIASPQDQAPSSTHDKNLLAAIYDHYAKDKHAFEGLAAFVAQKVLGDNCERGWVTPKGSDKGIDFVMKHALGVGFAETHVVVIGQAKCEDPEKSTSPLHLARTVAKLKRGWIGAYVTTGFFSKQCQQEVLEDRYPLLLIGGEIIVSEIAKEMAKTGLPLEAVLERETSWYEANMRHLEPQAILFGSLASADLREDIHPAP
jgi:hypothetical protein